LKNEEDGQADASMDNVRRVQNAVLTGDLISETNDLNAESLFKT
jgi:hypothetical protein